MPDGPLNNALSRKPVLPDDDCGLHGPKLRTTIGSPAHRRIGPAEVKA